jgi:hypothetical protein
MKQESRSQLTSQETAELPGDEAVAGKGVETGERNRLLFLCFAGLIV